MGDRVLRAGLDAKAAKDAAAVIYVVNLCIAFVATDPFRIRTRISLGLDVNTIRRTRGRAKVTRHAFFLSGFIDVQKVLPAVTRLNSYRLIRILHGPFLARDL